MTSAASVPFIAAAYVHAAWSYVWIALIHIRDVQCFAGARGMGMGCGWDVHVQDVQRGGMAGSCCIFPLASHVCPYACMHLGHGQTSQ